MIRALARSSQGAAVAALRGPRKWPANLPAAQLPTPPALSTPLFVSCLTHQPPAHPPACLPTTSPAHSCHCPSFLPPAESTYGKGKIQSVFELGDGSALFVTVAKYKTPAGSGEPAFIN